MSVPHNPNRPAVTPPTRQPRPYTFSHPLFTYTARSPPDAAITAAFPSPFEKEQDFSASPPLLYAFPHSVEECMARHLTKYPHPSVPEIVATPLLSDVTDPQTGVRRITRQVQCRNIAPWFIRQWAGGDYIYLEEKSVYDPRTRTFELHSENQTFRNLALAKEASLFRPHPDNKQHTSFVQHGGISCSSYLGPFKKKVEQFICTRMIRGGLQATDLLDDVLEAQAPF